MDSIRTVRSASAAASEPPDRSVAAVEGAIIAMRGMEGLCAAVAASGARPMARAAATRMASIVW